MFLFLQVLNLLQTNNKYKCNNEFIEKYIKEYNYKKYLKNYNNKIKDLKKYNNKIKDLKNYKVFGTDYNFI